VLHVREGAYCSVWHFERHGVEIQMDSSSLLSCTAHKHVILRILIYVQKVNNVKRLRASHSKLNIGLARRI
jgi:hypothetical protein